MPMRDLGRDVSHAARRLIAAPLFTLFAVATLALSIGATTAVYSTVHAVAFTPPDIPGVDRVAKLYHAPGGSTALSGFSWPDFLDLKARQQTFSHMAAWSRLTSAMATPQGSRPFTGEMVDGDYFAVLRAMPLHGRLIDPADDDPGAPPVVVLGAEFWQTAFGGDPRVVGTSVLIGGEPFLVAGVAHPSVRGVDMPALTPAAAWIPIQQRMRVARPGHLAFRDGQDRNNRWIRGIGRLSDGQTLDRANLELREIGAALDAALPLGDGDGTDTAAGDRYDNSRGWFARRLVDVRIHESTERVAGPLITTLFTAVGLVLAVACTNLANLLLARGAARRHELAMRRALGASRGRVIREQLVECALLAVAGGGLGVLVARALLVVLSADFSVGDNTGLLISVRPELNAPALLVASAATAVAMAVCGFVPAWYSTGGDVRSTLTADSGGALPRWRGRRVLIAVQVAVSVALLALTAVSAGNAWRMAHRETGLELDQLAHVAVDSSASKMPTGHAIGVLRDVADRARQAPGVSAAAVATALPIGSGSTNIELRAPERAKRTWVSAVEADPGYVHATGWSLLRGRDLTLDDRAGAAILVSARAAERVFGRPDVVGQTLIYRRQPTAGAPEPPDATATVVGVVTDIDDPGRRGSDGGSAILALGLDGSPQRLAVIARTSTPGDTAAHLKALVSAADPGLTLTQSGTGASLVDGMTMLLRVVGGTAGVLGAFALLLALVGLYGVLSFVVDRRRREIGVRMALGAERSTVRAMVLRDGFRPVAWGLAIGSVLATPVLLSPLAHSMLRLDNGGLAWALLAPTAMCVLAVVAIWIPARRASAVDPTLALRDP